MGLRVWWRRHPWWWGCSTALVGFLLLIVALACWERHRGIAELRRVLAEQKAAGIGADTSDYLASFPRPIDHALQEKARALFVGSSATWTVNAYSQPLQECLNAGASWNSEQKDRDLLKTDERVVAQVRALLADGRLVLDTAGFGMAEDGSVDRMLWQHIPNLLKARTAAERFAFEAACGDIAALDDLDRLLQATDPSTVAIDAFLRMAVARTRDKAYLLGIVRGEIGADRARDWLGEGPMAAPAMRAAYRGERLLYIGPWIRDVLEGRRVDDVDIGSTAWNPFGIGDWIHGPGALAEYVGFLGRLERGEASVPPAPPMRLFPRVMDTGMRQDLAQWRQIWFSALSDDHSHRLYRLAARLALEARAGRPLPSDVAEACALLGDTHALDAGPARAALTYRRRSDTAFEIGADARVAPPEWLDRNLAFRWSEIKWTPRRPRVSVGISAYVDLDPAPLPEAKR